ncbi:MAG: CoA-acylating methylmalonate-semialdehyde dehydrogenase [Planctomycetota bacterium]|jgi:malonate-semialdehyde dehydrogenase (acetylating)/methylmalonate-semialdehyde dehydrogenase
MSLKILKNYVGGKWIEPEHRGLLGVENPATGDMLAEVPLSAGSETDRAVAAAKAAFPAWSQTPVARRCDLLFKLAEGMRREFEGLARLVTQENGKSLPDSRAEVKRALENTEVACGMPVLQQGDKLIGGAADIDGEVLRLPLGVFGMIAPFNFPLMVPFWFFPYALATGNTYVVKPSEQVPLSMARLAEMIDEAGFPPGVFNVVNGDRAAAERLLENPDVTGVSFVGTSRVCRIIAARCAENNKRFQALGSAKNHLVAMPDAKMAPMIRNMITSCYGCAGQRCMASSAIVAVGDATYRDVCDRFVEASRQVLVADPLDPGVAEESMVMGPVISAKSKESILQMIQAGVDEGATLALDGRDLTIPGCEKGHFLGPTVFTDVKPGMKIHQTEIFGPVVVILKADTLEAAVGIINDHEYGNGASIYTQNGHHARRFKLQTRAGMIGVNVGIPAPVASLPFGGMKSSLFADTKGQGRAVIRFFTDEKIVTERYWPEGG